MNERERILYEAIELIAKKDDFPPDDATQSWIDEHWRGMVRTAQIAKGKVDRLGLDEADAEDNDRRHVLA